MEANEKKVVNKEVGKEMKTKDFIHILSITLSIIAIILSVIAISTSVCSNKGCRMQERPCGMYGQCEQYGLRRRPQRQFRGNNQSNRQWKYNQSGKGYGNNMPQWSNPWNNNSQNNFNFRQFGNFSKNNNDNAQRFNQNGNNRNRNNDNKIPAENENNAPKTDDQNIFPNSNAGIPMMPQ